MDVILQLLMQDFWLSQVEDLTSQNLHSCGILTAPLLSLASMSLLTEGKGTANNYSTAMQPEDGFLKTLCSFK
jgi:hypothetical protein